MHDIKHTQGRIGDGEGSRDDGEVLRDIVGNAEGGQCAARHQQLLADLHDLDQLGGVAVQVDHVGGLPGGLGAGVHSHGHIRLGQGRGVVGAVAGHGDQPAAGLGIPDQLELGLGSGLGQEVIHTGFGGNGRGRQRVIAGNHDRLDAHLAQLGETFLDAALDDIFQVDHAQGFIVAHHHQGRATGAGDPFNR